MKVYHTKLNQFFDIDSKELLDENMAIVSKAEEAHILQNDGSYVYWVEGLDLKISERKPAAYYTWDLDTKSWVIDEHAKEQYLSEKRNLIWEHIKEKRYLNSQSGVYVSSVNKWFQSGTEELEKYMVLTHTLKETRDKLKAVISQEQLSQQGGMLIPWTCYDNTYIDMTPELLKEILIELTFKNIQDHSCAANHKIKLWQSEDPMKYNYSTGWQPSYNKTGD